MDTAKRIAKRMSPKENRKRRKEACSVFLSHRNFPVTPEERIIMGKDFHMERRYHLHLPKTALWILLP